MPLIRSKKLDQNEYFNFRNLSGIDRTSGLVSYLPGHVSMLKCLEIAEIGIVTNSAKNQLFAKIYKTIISPLFP